MSIPIINFSKIQKQQRNVFKKENIFLLSGHGIEYINADRHPLAENQHALIPGGCGLKIQTPSASVYKQFFDFEENINVFHNKSKNLNISSKVGIQYDFLEENANGQNSPKQSSQIFKYYFPGSSDILRGTIPAMSISPLFVEKTTIDNNKFLRIELSGILRKTNPVLFSSGTGIYDTEYMRIIKYEDADLEKPLSESPITEVIKAALAGSLLTFNEMLTFMGKTEEVASVNDIINYIIYLPYIFNFISSKVEEPFVLIVLTCRDAAKPAIPKTPSRSISVSEERKKIIENARRLRRQSSVGNLPSALFGLEDVAVGLSALFGGKARKTRRRVGRRRRLTRRR